MEATTEENAKSQARAQLESIIEMVEPLSAETDDDDDERDAAIQAIQEDALSVEIRSGWVSAGDFSCMVPAEFRILLCTGGPAVQIVGELDEHNEPERNSIRLQYQDWFTPWTDCQITGSERDALTTYAQQFYYG